MTSTAATFWWEKFPVTRARREWTPLRLKFAARAVQREADEMPMFPELRRVSSVEQRVEMMDERTDELVARLRNLRAQNWRIARQVLRTLPAGERQCVLTKWNTRFMPGGPADLLAMIGMLKRSSTVMMIPILDPVSHAKAVAQAASVTVEQVYTLLKTRYLHSRFEGRNDAINGSDYSLVVARSHLEQLQTHGYLMISKYESVTGESVVFDGNLVERENSWFRDLVSSELRGD